MIRKKKHPHVPTLAVDSLVDIFMNAFAIVMFSSIALALSLGSHSKNALVQAQKQSDKEEPIKLKLPETRNVSTNPVYIWMRPDGVKVVNGNTRFEQLTTNQHEMDGQTQVKPILNSSITLNQAHSMAKSVDGSENHIIFLVHPNGIKHFKAFREVFEKARVASGWIPFSEDLIFLGTNGRSPSEVQ